MITPNRRANVPKITKYHILALAQLQRVDWYVNIFFGDTTEHFPVTPGGVNRIISTRRRHRKRVMTLSVSWLEVHPIIRLRSSWCGRHLKQNIDTGSQIDAGQRRGGEHKAPAALSIRAVGWSAAAPLPEPGLGWRVVGD